MLRQAERGDEIVILRRGVRVAVILGQSRYEELAAPPKEGWAERLRGVARGMLRLSRAELARLLSRRREGLA